MTSQDIINVANDLQKSKEVVDELNKKLLISVLEKIDNYKFTNMKKAVEQRGVPSMVILSYHLYDALKEIFGEFATVRIEHLSEVPTIFFFWEDVEILGEQIPIM